MQTLQPLRLRWTGRAVALAVMLAGAMPVAGHAVDLSAAMACHDKAKGRERLACYDDATGYLPDVLALARQDSTAPPLKTRYGRFLDGLFAGQTSATRVRLTVMDPETGATVAIAEEGSDAFDGWMKSDPKEHDFYLTFLGRETGTMAGEARLVLACEQEITQIVVLWNGILKAGSAPARLYSDDRADAPLQTLMRVIDNGYGTRAPRGFEAITLLKTLRRHGRLQVSIDQDSEETRSALFDIDGLDRYLRPLARRCGWS